MPELRITSMLVPQFWITHYVKLSTIRNLPNSNRCEDSESAHIERTFLCEGAKLDENPGEFEIELLWVVSSISWYNFRLRSSSGSYEIYPKM